ncbi:MAG: alpha-amylase/4-alpha-glucanotransferase domain-containing protein [Anaerolineae bacterium]
MPPINLALLLHNHQPVGNLPEVFSATYKCAYEPMLAQLESHPGIRFIAHYSGPLLEWLAAEHPSFLVRLRALLEQGRLELLGGGLQEPILAVIPDADKYGQVCAMSAWLSDVFGVRPRGAWLAERVWEPHLPPFLARSGIHYTVLDEDHFGKAGLPVAALDSFYTTEDNGQVLRVFPASTELRYLIPWRGVEEVLAYLRSQWQRGRRLLVFADDGEKFGSWPGTYSHCYEQGWLGRFFTAVEENSSWLRTTTLANYLEENNPNGRVYLPSSSYHEMEEWSLPPETRLALQATRDKVAATGLSEASSFMRLGHWRNFLARYQEVNVAHQRAIAISAKVHALPHSPTREQALAHLWRGQCNCPYWHGVFGGIYMYHIRHATFNELIAAEALAEPLAPSVATVEFGDYDADGYPEVRLVNQQQSLFIHQHGGHLYEWDLRPLPINLLNTLASYREAYEPPDDTGSVARLLMPRWAFVDRLLESMPSATSVSYDQWPELGDFALGRYELSGQRETGKASAAATHSVSFNLDSKPVEMAILKTYTIQADSKSLTVAYQVLTNQLLARAKALATEINLAMPPGSHQYGSITCRQRQYGLLEMWEEQAAHELMLSTTVNRKLNVSIQWDRDARVFSQPLLSRHRSELGSEHVYQGSRLVLAWELPLTDTLEWTAALRLTWSDGSAI